MTGSNIELGDFLRSRRLRLRPEECGIRPARRRRTAGLRREEVAEFAGIGVDWYNRLEQGRAVRPSVTTVDALARALRLDITEHRHLRRLAGAEDPAPFTPETMPPAIKRMIDHLSAPAYVTGRRWDILGWNAAANEVFAFDQVASEDRNILLLMSTTQKARRLFGAAWENEARRMVAQFRTTHDLWAGDPAFLGLLDRLRAECAEFDGWWNLHDIREAATGRKQLFHSRFGDMNFEYVSFQANDDPSLKLVIYTPIAA